MNKFTTATHWGAYEVEVEDGKVSALTPIAADPDPSPIGPGMPQALYDPARIQQPMIRKAWLDKKGGKSRGQGPFVAVSWERALDLAAIEIERVRSEHGNGAIFAGSYGWASAGRFHHANSQLHRFMNTAGGYVSSKDTYSLAAGDVVLRHVVGTNTFGTLDVATPLSMVAAHTNLVVCFGGIPVKNAQVQGGGMGEHGVSPALKQCKERGVAFVNFGPLRSDLADFVEAEWHASRPNTDTAIMIGLAHTLVANDLHDPAFLTSHTVGFERFNAYLMGETDGVVKDAAWAGDIAGLDPAIIEDLARRMAAGRTMINVAWAIQRGDHGEMAFWMAAVLGAILGQVGLPGGGFTFGYGATNTVGTARSNIPKPALPQGENAIRDFIPVSRIADMLLGAGTEYDYDGDTRTYPDIKLVYWCGGNPYHHHQDLNRLVEAWQKPDTVIVHEPWWNANARHADIIFPIATSLERNDIGTGRVDQYVFAMHKAADAPGQSRTDYEIFSALAERLGCADAFTEGRDEKAWLEHLYQRFQQTASEFVDDVPSLEEFWDKGSYVLPPCDNGPYLGEFREDPKAHPLPTPSGKIEIFSETVDGFGYDDCPGHPTWLEPLEWLGADAAGDHPLHLITNQPTTRLHSQYDNGGYSQDSKIQGREPATLNPADAAVRDIKDGDVIRLFNGRGACLAGVRISEDVRAGVVQLSTGAWFDPLDPAEPGSLEVHGNPNVLTKDIGTSKLAQGPSAMSALVEVEKFEGELPPVKAFTPPEVMSE
ncbi:MAG: molybdopterin-dependent oxidoreductase [Rhodospirillaceae bacterium]